MILPVMQSVSKICLKLTDATVIRTLIRVSDELDAATYG